MNEREIQNHKQKQKQEHHPIRLIACDLDGTLLLHGAQTCTPRALELIEKLCDQGIYFMPASGRQYPNLRRLFAPVADQIMYLCENGSLVMKDDRPIEKRIFPRELAMELCHAVLERPDCEVLISGERTSYILPKRDSYRRFLEETVRNNITVVKTPEEIPEEIMKVSFYTRKEDRDIAGNALKQQFGERAWMVVSGLEWIDFAPVGTSKASALAAVGRKLGIAPEEMAAFGDNENDRAMLEFVGHPYLMRECNPTMEDLEKNCGALRCDTVEEELEKLLISLVG